MKKIQSWNESRHSFQKMQHELTSKESIWLLLLISTSCSSWLRLRKLVDTVSQTDRTTQPSILNCSTHTGTETFHSHACFLSCSGSNWSYTLTESNWREGESLMKWTKDEKRAMDLFRFATGKPVIFHRFCKCFPSIELFIPNIH